VSHNPALVLIYVLVLGFAVLELVLFFRAARTKRRWK